MDSRPKHTAILYLHGLSFPVQAAYHCDSIHWRLASHFSAPTSSCLHFRSPNYATLLYPSIRSHYNVSFQKSTSFGENLLMLFKMIPYALFAQGMRYYARPEWRAIVLGTVIKAIRELIEEILQEEGVTAQDDHWREALDKTRFVMAGFSMGGSITYDLVSLIEKIFAEKGDEDNTEEKNERTGIDGTAVGEWSTQEWEKVLKACMGGDEKWVKIVLYFLRYRLELIFTMGCAIQWHFPARPFCRQIPTQTRWLNIYYETDVLASSLHHIIPQVEDILIRYNGEYLHSNGSQVFSLTNSKHSRLTSLELLMAEFTWNRTPLGYLSRLTPFSHLVYCFDPAIFNLLHTKLDSLESIVHSSLKLPSKSLTPLSSRLENSKLSEGIIRSPNGAVTLQLFNLSAFLHAFDDPTTKKSIIIFFHGCSDNETMLEEDILVEKNVRRILKPLKKKQIEYLLILVDMSGDGREEMYRNINRNEQENGLSGWISSHMNIWVPSFNKLRRHVMNRFPITMGYITEPYLRTSVHIGLQYCFSQLEVLLGSSPPSLKIIYLTSNSGALIAYEHIHRLSANLQQGILSHVDVFITTGSWLPWITDPDYLSFPEALHGRWLNLFYPRDFASGPLAPVFGDEIVDVRLPSMQWGWWKEIWASYFGGYLRDVREACVWGILEKVVRELNWESLVQ